MFPKAMTKLTLAATVAALLATAPDPAAAFRGRMNTEVNPVNNAVFEVVTRGPSRTNGAHWCGAADYARRVMKASWQTRIYVARSWGPSVTTGRRSAVQFTIDPAAAGITPRGAALSVNQMPVGDNMSVQQANLYCTMSPINF